MESLWAISSAAPNTSKHASPVALSNTDQDQHFGRHEFVTETPGVAIPVVVVLVLASIIGTTGNILTLLVFATRKNLRRVENIFMINLVFSDLYVTLVADPMSIVAKIEGEEFFDRVPGLCQTIASLCTVSCVTSLMTIGLMSFNRFFYICVHDKYERIFTKRKCICMCICLYFIGGFLVLLNAADVGDHGFDRKSLECIWDRMATYPYTVVFSVTLVWIPSFIIGSCYLRLFLYVRAHSRRMREQNLGSKTRSCHLAKTLFIIYAVFVTCWTPYALLIVIDSDNTYPHEIHVYITTFAHLHPSVNWLIYYLTNKHLADGYRSLFRSCKKVSYEESSTTDGTLTSKTKTSTLREKEKSESIM